MTIKNFFSDSEIYLMCRIVSLVLSEFQEIACEALPDANEEALLYLETKINSLETE